MFGEKALAIKIATLGAEHPDVAASFYNLAGTHEDLGKHATAVDCATKAVSIWTKTLGAEHPDTIDAEALLADLRA